MPNSKSYVRDPEKERVWKRASRERLGSEGRERRIAEMREARALLLKEMEKGRSLNEIHRLTGVSIKTVCRWIEAEPVEHHEVTVKKLMLLSFDHPKNGGAMGVSYRTKDIDRVYNALERASAEGYDADRIAFLSGINQQAIIKILATPRGERKRIGRQAVRGAEILERHFARGSRKRRSKAHQVRG